jgi:hypothetical protein
MSLTLLRVAVDTLETSIGGQLFEHATLLLEDLKAAALSSGTPQYAPLAGLDFAVQAYGSKPFRYVLEGELARIRLSPVANVPGASIRLSALGLALYEPLPLHDLVSAVVADYFGPGAPPKLSRIDVAADFQGLDLADLGRARFVSPATYRPIFPSVERPETYYFGKAPLQVRIYNKTQELQKSGKFWMRQLWAQHPDYDPELDVWRFEIEVRREVLRKLRYHTPNQAVEDSAAILRHGLTRQASLRIPKGQSSDRWRLHPAWESLIEANGNHTTLTRDKADQSLTSLSRIVPVVAGYAISAGAVRHIRDFETVWALLGDRVRKHLGSEEAFGEMVRLRRLERLGKGGSA